MNIINNGFSHETYEQSCDGCIFYYPLLKRCDMDRLENLKKYDRQRFCNYYRNEDWQEHYWNGGQSLEDRAIDEARLPFDLVVYDEDGADADSYLDLLEDLQSESYEGVSPRQVIFVVNTTKTNIPEVGMAIRKVNPKFSWKIKNIVGEDTSFEEAVDSASKDCKSPFMMVMSLRYVIPLGTFDRIDNLYNNRFKPIALITESSGNFFMVDKLLFDSLGRNGGTYPEDSEFGYLRGNAINKITQQAHKENRADRLWDLGDILS